MKNAHLDEMLFDKFIEILESKGIKPQGGALVDGTFVEVLRQNNTKDENAQIKNGEVPKSFAANNRLKSKVRCHIAHVFGEQKMRMKEETLRSIGFARKKFCSVVFRGNQKFGQQYKPVFNVAKVGQSDIVQRYSVLLAKLSR